MSEDLILALVCTYLAGAMVTLFSLDDFVAINRRVFLWPLYWAYLAAFMALLLWKEVRK